MYYVLGDYYTESDFDQALIQYENALDMYEASSILESSYPYEVYIYEALGNTHYGLGNYQRSADYLYDVLNFDYDYEEEPVENVVADLDDIKYTEMNNKVSLLEQLNIANEERITLSKSLIRVMIISIMVLLIAVVIIIFEIRSKSKTEKELYKNSITDSLTQVYNRGKIIDVFSNNLEEENAVLLLDLDNFKDINDTYGHVVGDDVLIKVTEIIKSSIRETDTLGRYGGEEFMVFLEKTDNKELSEVAERVRHNLETYEWPYENLVTTASIGITNCFSKDAETVLHEVDTLMYKAKNSGKNKVAFA
jgi:diguanylate cyclase (GGDEF)-like protein